MTLRPGVPNRASMCSYRTVGDGRQKIRSCHWRMRGTPQAPAASKTTNTLTITRQPAAPFCRIPAGPGPGPR